MRCVKTWMLVMALVAMSTMAACSSESASPASNEPMTAETTAAGSSGSTIVIDPADFSTSIDNLYFPLHRGTSYVYEGSSKDGATRVQATVLFESRVVMGVECRVVLEKVFVRDELRESTHKWYAQDGDGNVWQFGKDSEEYKEGEVTSTAGSWEAGIDGAAPGIVMKADPQVGDVYQQRYLAGEAEGMAEVLGVDASVEVPYSSFNHVLKIKEWTSLDPGVIQEKYYGPGMGLVLREQVEGGSEWERLIALYGF